MNNLSDWYWTVAGDQTNVWSSAQAKSVPVNDAGYVAWKALPNRYTTPIESMTALRAVLAEQYPPGMLEAYAADARYRKTSGGVIITGLSPVPFLSEPVARNTLANASEYSKSMPAGYITQWKLSDGSFIPLTSAQLSTASVNMVQFVQSCFTKESELLAGIANSSITTTAQIDVAFAAISNVFP